MKNPFDFLKRLGLDTFILLLFLCIFLAWLDPRWGSGRETFSLSTAANYGVSVIFFFYGLRLNWEKIRTGLADFRLHVLIQAATFVLFPLLILPLMLIFGRADGGGYDTLWLGIFFVAALPSTVSSSVVMVNIARGNVTAAIFNASVSSLLGVLLTPLWMQIFIAAGGGVPLSGVLISLTLQVILPVTLGILLHRPLGWFSRKYDRPLRRCDQAIILLIVYTSFCHSFSENMFAGFTLGKLGLLAAGMAALFFAVYGILWVTCHALGMKREDTVTVLFCGSKKSLVHGTVMSRVLLKDAGQAGILLLPIMIYHAMQLIIVSVIARKLGEKSPHQE